MNKNERVVILGASKNPDRYSYKALKMLTEHGHTPLPVNPKLSELEGVTCYPRLSDVPRPVDTLTIYVKPAILEKMVPMILELKPQRAIFNPGTETPEVEQSLKNAGIETQHACTLVLLSTGQY